MEAEYKGIVENKIQWRYFLRQTFVGLTVITFYFIFGLVMGAPTVLVPQLRREANSTEAVSEEMASWITSVIPYTATFWVIVLTTSTHYFGRKKLSVIVAINALGGNILLYYSKNIYHIFFSQLMQGMTQSAQTTICNLIVLEYMSPRYRGAFLGFFCATFFWGIWFSNAIGIYFHYRNIGLLGMMCSLYALITSLCIPESPYWLATQERYDECTTVHRWLKGVDDISEKELEALIQYQKSEKNQKTAKMTACRYVMVYTKVLTEPEIYKPILLILALMGSYVFSGKFVFAIYAVEIMKKITQSETEALTGVLILDGVSVLGMYLGSLLTRFFKRRTLLLSGSLICAAFLFALSTYLYLVELSMISENYYVSIALLVGFSLASCCGPIVMGTILFAELYPLKYRTFAVVCICCMMKIIIGTTLKLSPYVIKAFQVHGAFLCFGVVLVLILALIYKYLPETKDKTSEEIAIIFRTKHLEYTESKLLEIEKEKS